MNHEQLANFLNELIQLPAENGWVEFKVANHDPQHLGEIISGLANTANLEGKAHGYLVYGVDDISHKIVGTSFVPAKVKHGNAELINWLTQRLNPKITMDVHHLLIDGKSVVMFEIPAATDRPVSFSQTEYVRIGSYNRKLNEFPEKERQIWSNINRKSFEKNIASSNLTSDEILDLIDYAQYFTSTSQKLPTEKSGILERLEQDKLIRKSRGLYGVTNLGAILWARNLSSFESVKRKVVRVIIYKDKDKIDTLKEEGFNQGYAISFPSIIKYINDQVPSNEEIQKAVRMERKMYPDIAIRELVANALIHQDLSEIGTGPMVEIFKDRIEISNPGAPLISTDRFIDHSPQSRNEDSAAFMRRINFCEERGSGIDKVIKSVEVFQLPAPEFANETNFTKVTLFSHRGLDNMDKADKIRACYQHCVLKYVSKEYMTNASLRKRFNITDNNYSIASRIIKSTIEAGLIKPTNPDYNKTDYIPFWA
jgi:ATP-dependent DNA helicase RecG